MSRKPAEPAALQGREVGRDVGANALTDLSTLLADVLRTSKPGHCVAGKPRRGVPWSNDFAKQSIVSDTSSEIHLAPLACSPSSAHKN
jgi:hypothetical protein